jgi:uncharacterized protein
MSSSSLLLNILNPPVLFFFGGMIATLMKSDLEIPKPLPKLFSLYLLLAIGFKGGHEVLESGFTPEILLTLLTAVSMACLVPIYSFFVLRLKFDTYNAAAIAATYGSISAVTFVTASSFLSKLNIEYGGHMIAALALMESPAIIVGLMLVRLYADRKVGDEEFSWGEVLREAFLNGSVVILMISLVAGYSTGEVGWTKMKPFVDDMFYGVLVFFLLDMGLVSAKRLGDLTKAGTFPILFSILMPIFNALFGIVVAAMIGMSQGNALLFSVLCASASYIAVPAAMRLSVPEANPSLYVSMALALTFPFNIVVGIPVYFEIIKKLWGTA